jgi:TRAP-type C4-dicarboxylate transport system substrate-binding protein
MIRGLGGAPVRLALGEVYSALDKGVIDGIMMMAIGALDYKWYEVVKYMVRPIFGEVVCPILVNLNSWKNLPKDLQDLLDRTAIDIEESGRLR